MIYPRHVQGIRSLERARRKTPRVFSFCVAILTGRGVTAERGLSACEERMMRLGSLHASRLTAMQRHFALPHMRHAPLGSRSCGSKLSGAALDAEIAAMNAEMADLFGSPVGESNGQQHSYYEPPAPAPDSLQSHRPALSAMPSPPPEAVGSARSALLGTMQTAATELSSVADAGAGLDVDRSTKLAACIAECARAVVELERIQR